MAQHITTGIAQLCAQANSEIDSIDATRAIELSGAREDVLIVDIRDIRELWRDGRVPGAVHVPRGMLEFWIDPDSPYHKPVFGEDKTFVFMCAGGMRSALATQAAQRMGLKPVLNLTGGFGAWKKAEGPVEPHPGAPKQE